MKKLWWLLAGVAIILAASVSSTFAYTQEESDAYQWAYMYGITTQPTIEKANLDWNITRQALAKMIVNYLENVAWVDQTTNTCTFPDEEKITSDLKIYAKKTCGYKIMWTNGKAFNPTQPVDRAQLWTVLSRILWWDQYNSNWKNYYIYHLNALQYAWIMNNISNPNSNVRRWEVFVMLKRMSDKYGWYISLNWYETSAYDDSLPQANHSNTTIEYERWTEEDEDTYYYQDDSIVYTWSDWKKYTYDVEFLKLLKDKADKKWETDLKKYLDIEYEWLKAWSDQTENLDDTMNNLPELLWIDEDELDFDKMTDSQKSEFIKKAKELLTKEFNKNKDRNNQYVKDLEKVTKNLGNDKFWLKEKYTKTKWFIASANSFLDLYIEIMFKVLELGVLYWDDVDDGEVMSLYFSLMSATFMFQSEADSYQDYLNTWAKDTVKLLEASDTKTNNSNTKVQEKAKVSLIFFYWDSCPYCKTEAWYITELQKKYDFNIEMYEVYNHPDNAKKMNEYAAKLWTTFTWVPVVIMGTDYVEWANYNKTAALIDKYANKK